MLDSSIYIDLVPIVPGRFMGFAHPHGEVHILSPGKAVSCPGVSIPKKNITQDHIIIYDTIGDDDATDSECQIQSVPNVFDGNILDHVSTQLLVSGTDSPKLITQI